jgi:hypothetical protein
LRARRKIVTTSNSADQPSIEKSDTVTRRVSRRERERPSGRGRERRRKRKRHSLGKRRRKETSFEESTKMGMKKNLYVAGVATTSMAQGVDRWKSVAASP